MLRKNIGFDEKFKNLYFLKLNILGRNEVGTIFLQIRKLELQRDQAENLSLFESQIPPASIWLCTWIK